MNKNLETLQKYIDEAKNIVFFGGAGVSTESGIPDFRSASGIFTKNLSAEKIVSHTYFYSHTKEFYDFYKNKMMFLSAKPNACHQKLAEMEQSGKKITIITQNIDGLHQIAGSKNVIELHGSIHRNYCTSCHKFFSAECIKNSTSIPHCDECGSIIKPDVVLYEEELDMNNIISAIDAIEKADLLIIGGTSLKVYPAASFIKYYRGNKKVYINLNNNPLSLDYLYINDKIGSVFKEIK